MAINDIFLNYVTGRKYRYDLTKDIASVPSKDSDQPRHLLSLISLCCRL